MNIRLSSLNCWIAYWVEKKFKRLDELSQWLFRPLLLRFPEWLTPNRLSASRIPIAIVIILLLTNHYHKTIIMLLVLLAGLTDYFDGLLARVKKITSEFGATLDRTIDKIFTIPLLTALIFTTFTEKKWIIIAIIYCLVDLISLYQTVDRLLREIPTAPSNIIGKIKFIFIFFFLLLSPYSYSWSYYSLLLPAAIMAIWSMTNHTKREIKQTSPKIK